VKFNFTTAKLTLLRRVECFFCIGVFIFLFSW